ncbi:fucolectin-like [Plakobranchus ocellatus]|uniref:Fucolectin-like n=1 Tax=Plakobranchus ocellatus TaxID=259542 RepID=A0AAV3YPA9_9GAST|nr:fucolectin-like [Plakobranchus ocellatus]
MSMIKASHGANLALHRPTAQGPETFTNELSRNTPSLYLSNKAVDGNADGTLYSHCSHTIDAPIMWWLVDLEDSCQIHSVALLNRDESSYRLQNFTIDIFRKDPRLEPTFPENFGQICAHQVDPVGASQWVELDCNNGPVTGQFVRIVKRSFEALTLCQVKF